jgi:hypothetical protein
MKDIVTFYRDEIYSIIFGVIIIFSGVFLFMQPPYLLSSPDISYHAAKILRVMHGDFFTDPVSGFTSYYPPLFHILIGIVNRAIQLNPVDLIKAITILNLTGLFLLVYLITYLYTNQRSLAAICAVGCGLTFYEIAWKYILLANPYNNALLFALFGLSIVLSGLLKKNRGYLAVGIFLLIVSSCMWYYNITLLLATILSLIIVYNSPNEKIKEKTITIFSIILILSGVALFLYRLSSDIIRWISPVALTITPDLVFKTLISFFALGTEHFLDSGYHFSPELQPIWILDLSFLSVLYFGILIPINVFFFAYPFYLLYRKKEIFKAEDFFLLIISTLIIIFSIGGHFFEPDNSRITRIQNIAHLLFMIVSVSLLSRSMVLSTRKIMQGFIFCVGSTLILLTVFFNPYGVLPSGHPDADTQDLITYIESVPNHEQMRIFMSETSVCNLYEFVTFFSYTYHRRYGTWDGTQGDKISSLLASYDQIATYNPHWREVLRKENTTLMIFDCIDEGEYSLAEKYVNDSVPVWHNKRWIVLKPDLTI